MNPAPPVTSALMMREDSLPKRSSSYDIAPTFRGDQGKKCPCVSALSGPLKKVVELREPLPRAPCQARMRGRVKVGHPLGDKRGAPGVVTLHRMEEGKRMGTSGWSVAVLTAAAGLWLASGISHERPVLTATAAQSIDKLEATVAAHPEDASALRELAQGYLEARSPGLAMSLIQRAPVSARADARVTHVYARALLDQGLAEEALAAEHRVLDVCAAGSCETWLIASATRRADILHELVQLGVEDAQAHPEQSAIAYTNATREARLAVAVE